MRRRLVCTLAGAVLLLGGAAGAGGLDRLDIEIGAALFDRAWIPAPASTRGDDGLGPLFDARSCAACHPRGGRAPLAFAPDGTMQGRGAVLVLARPDGTPDPVYGRRLQLDAVPGLVPEGVLGAIDTVLPDGRRARAPAPTRLAYGPLDPATGLSLRAAPDLRGRGLIDRVPEQALVEIAAGQEAAVRGRVRRILLADGRSVVGRYGWKASQPDLKSQSAEAFFLDIGMSTRLHPEPWGDCAAVQTACRAAPHGRETEGDVEIPPALLSRVVAYVAALPLPPTPRDAQGARLFAATGCAQCHRPELPLEGGGKARLFTDLLLHDLGPGLADALSEPGAAESEWRTAPLAGLADALARGTGLLHDGRANSVAAAIAWHGGQAEGSAQRFARLSARDRQRLLAYVSKL
ncbi:di-heme oxidoredictase family protein [Aquabacter spiritensis]|uniref:CxxC motif-containing protein (DUF1111 family) n=1 Tax=Aquabacter spiritensis TaxID=933073 RepID=A0A4R3M4A9_9HYPH|nr:di-heme oxidoredictase family protein [Aquabacter spiritensis]TCT07666.1 CxxC motif-containing protein (DUF1111 family) [Aquabacter spiritensis]